MIAQSGESLGAAPGRDRPGSRLLGGPVAVAPWALIAAATAVSLPQSWSKVVFVIFAVVVAWLTRPPERRLEVVRLSITMVGIVVLANVALYLIGFSSLGEYVVCRQSPCPWLGPTMLITGTAATLAAAVVIGGLIRYARQGRTRFLLPAVGVALAGTLAMLLIDAPGSGSIVEVGDLAVVIAVIRNLPATPGLLRAAVLAQAADLAMFGFVWHLGTGERNPLGRWTVEALVALGPGNAPWDAAIAAGMLLILAKLALIGYLVRVTPLLGRFRRPVLLVAILAGAAGAVGSLITWLP